MYPACCRSAADPSRNRFYIIRQDTNQVLVFDASNNAQSAPCAPAPRRCRWPSPPIISTCWWDSTTGISCPSSIWIRCSFHLGAHSGGHYPRSVAVSGRDILAASRVAGPVNQISQIDLDSRTGTPLPTLGPYHQQHQCGYRAGRFASRRLHHGRHARRHSAALRFQRRYVHRRAKDYPSLSAPTPPRTWGSSPIDTTSLTSRCPESPCSIKEGGTSGFAFAGSTVFRTSGPVTGAIQVHQARSTLPGLIERVNLTNPNSPLSTRTIERRYFPGFGGRQWHSPTAQTSFIARWPRFPTELSSR